MHPIARPAAGLTLIEVAIALAIAVILGALTLPSFSAILQQRRLAAAAGALAADIGEARQEAIRRRADVELRFGAEGGRWCWAIIPAGAADAASADSRPDCAPPAPGPTLKRVAAVDHPGITLLETRTMRLAPDGAAVSVDAPSVVLANPRGEQVRVRLSRLGRATICTLNTPLTGMTPCREPG